jgi:medium-chain acyl-[acyl-carrier-protein] hydrolase
MNKWLLPLKPNPTARLRVIGFPHSGGGGRAFSPWMAGLPEDIEFLAVQLPGREERFREPPHSRMEPLVEALLPALAPYLDMPLVLFGHSLGGLIAFEVARVLTSQKLSSPAHVIVSSTWAAHLPPPMPLMHLLSDDELQDRLRALEGTPQEVLGHELLRAFLPLIRADMAVGETYVYPGGEPLTCPLTVYGGADDAIISSQSLEAWKSLTSGPLKLRLFPGGHFYWKHSDLFWAALAEALNRTSPWQKPYEQITIKEGEVHIWRAGLELPSCELDLLSKNLSAEEKNRAAAFHFQKDRDRFIAAHGFFRVVLGRYLKIAPDEVGFHLGPAGKPGLAGQSPIRFNLSHSGSCALVGITMNRDIGVDIEKSRPMPDALQMAKRFFSPGENRVLQELAGDPSAFFRCWTRKEAYIKGRGQGLSLGLERFEVAFAPGEPARLLRMEGEPEAPDRWWLADLPVGPDFVGACAVDRGPCRLLFWDWS